MNKLIHQERKCGKAFGVIFTRTSTNILRIEPISQHIPLQQ